MTYRQWFRRPALDSLLRSGFLSLAAVLSVRSPGPALLRRCWLGLLALTVGVVTPEPGKAAGFALVQQGTAAMAQGNAFVAEANDPSAIFYNPAGLNQLRRPEVYLATIFNAPDREYHGSGGAFSQTNHRLYRSSSLYLVWPIHKRVAAGIGLFAPFGLGTAWPPGWAGRYLTTLSSLKTYNLNPVVSVKLWRNVSVAVGFNALYADVELKRQLPVVVGATVLPDGEAALSGDGTGFGFNAGALYEPWSGVKLGLSYRSSIDVTLKGDLQTFLPAPLPSLAPIPGSARLNLPPSLTFGLSLSRWQPVTVNVDVTWTGWSTYDRLKVDLDRPLLVNGRLTQSLITPKNWRDAWAFRVGANYQLGEKMKLRAGYIYDQTPVPDATFDPQVPDNDRHIFTLGGDLTISRFTLGLAYNYIYSEQRTKANALGLNGQSLPAALQANGTYKSDVHSLGLSLSARF
jgi:long-chain fatty acid transport protein